MEYLAIVLGLILLIKGGDWVLDSAILFSLRLNIPKIVVGMTVVSFATSAPELIVSINAALNGYPDLAVGNIVGSNRDFILLLTCIILSNLLKSSFIKVFAHLHGDKLKDFLDK